jgi:hypothetical protein
MVSVDIQSAVKAAPILRIVPITRLWSPGQMRPLAIVNVVISGPGLTALIAPFSTIYPPIAPDAPAHSTKGSIPRATSNAPTSTTARTTPPT